MTVVTARIKLNILKNRVACGIVHPLEPMRQMYSCSSSSSGYERRQAGLLRFQIAVLRTHMYFPIIQPIPDPTLCPSFRRRITITWRCKEWCSTSSHRCWSKSTCRPEAWRSSWQWKRRWTQAFRGSRWFSLVTSLVPSFSPERGVYLQVWFVCESRAAVRFEGWWF